MKYKKFIISLCAIFLLISAFSFAGCAKNENESYYIRTDSVFINCDKPLRLCSLTIKIGEQYNLVKTYFPDITQKNWGVLSYYTYHTFDSPEQILSVEATFLINNELVYYTDATYIQLIRSEPFGFITDEDGNTEKEEIGDGYFYFINNGQKTKIWETEYSSNIGSKLTIQFIES